MFGIFKKEAILSGKGIELADKIALKFKSQNEIIEEIHESFYTEVDKLLADSKILKSTESLLQDLLDKSNKLKSLGFINTKECKDAQVEIDRLNTIKQINIEKNDINEAIHYFSQKYPLYKFITEDSVNKICNKYGLVYGSIERYIGTVPNKNINDMLNFKIKEEDTCCYKMRTNRFDYYPNKNIIEGYVSKFNYNKEIKISKLKYDPSLFEYAICPMEIATVLKDFNMEGHELEGNKIKIKQIVDEDPIVLQPVFFKYKKHYLIVTAWGLEASDELVLNKINN